MKILIACEESQEVCKAMRKRGHDAVMSDKRHRTDLHFQQFSAVSELQRKVQSKSKITDIHGSGRSHGRIMGNDICRPQTATQLNNPESDDRNKTQLFDAAE